jgi:hypothetical protein
LLQRVTPIDHFPLSFLCLRRIDPLAVAIKQQNSGLQCHALSFPKEHCLRKFNGLLIHACEGRHLPLGKLFPQFCEGKSVVDQPTLCCGRRMLARPCRLRHVFVGHVGPGGARKITGVALAAAQCIDAAKLAYGTAAARGRFLASRKPPSKGKSSTKGLTRTSSNGH